jgi:hypothetical protein
MHAQLGWHGLEPQENPRGWGRINGAHLGIVACLEDLAERRLPRRGPVNIVGADEAECRKHLEEIEAAGQRPAHVRFIMTGVPRSENFGRWRARESAGEISE